MTLQAIVTILSSIAVILGSVNSILYKRHSNSDSTLFTDHERRLNNIENGKH